MPRRRMRRLAAEPGSDRGLVNQVRVLMGEGKVLPRGHGSGVVRAIQPLASSQDLLEQRNRFRGLARLPVGDREVVPSAQGAWVVHAEQPLTSGQDQLE